MRLIKGWRRNTLAERAGVTAASLKRFETTGKASLELVLKVAHALARLSATGAGSSDHVLYFREVACNAIYAK